MNWDEIISEYQSHLKLEKNLSDNSIEAYLRDIKKLKDFFDQSPLKIQQNQIEEFIYQFAKLDYSPRTQARLISSLKSFFNYLQWEELRDDNPSELIETPKMGMKLPNVLSENEIDTIFAQFELIDSAIARKRAHIDYIF